MKKLNPGTTIFKKGGIHIKKENRGKFTASAKAAGHSVQEHARAVLADPNATPLQKKRANFARNAAKWHHEDGGLIPHQREEVLEGRLGEFDENLKKDFKKGGIHIKKENVGKFTATKKKTGKTTEQLTHSKNPLTRKRAIFAQNAKKWHHQDGGVIANKPFGSDAPETVVSPFVPPSFPNAPQSQPLLKDIPAVMKSEAMEARQQEIQRRASRPANPFNAFADAEQDALYAYQDALPKSSKIYKFDKNSPDNLRLTSGKFRSAKVPKEVIRDLYAAAKANGMDPMDMLALAGQESTFGADTGWDEGKGYSVSQQNIVSGWNLAEDYVPRKALRFLADRKIPGVKATSGTHGWTYDVEDEAAMHAHLTKHPELIDQYKQTLAKQGSLPSDFNYFNKAGERVKKHGYAQYNPKDKTYTDSIANSRRLLSQDTGLQNYLKELDVEYNKKSKQPEDNLKVPKKKMEMGGISLSPEAPQGYVLHDGNSDYTDMNTMSANLMQANTYKKKKKGLKEGFQMGGAKTGMWSAGGAGTAGASAVGNIAGDLVSNIGKDEYGVTSYGAAIGGGALKGAALGTTIMPGWGTLIGGIIGGAVGGIKNKVASKKRTKALEGIARQRNLQNANESEVILANYDNLGTGIKSFNWGGTVSAPGAFGNDGNYHYNNSSFPAVKGFQQGGEMPVENGSLKPISNNAVEVQGDNPGATDDVGYQDAYVDHGEVMKPAAEGTIIFSDHLKVPGTPRTFAKEAKRLEKSKSLPGRPNPNQDALIESKLKALFHTQQRLNGDSHGETTEQAIQPAGETPGAGMSEGNMFRLGGLSPKNVAYHDINQKRYGSSPEGVATNIMSKRYYHQGGNIGEVIFETPGFKKELRREPGHGPGAATFDLGGVDTSSLYTTPLLPGALRKPVNLTQYQNRRPTSLLTSPINGKAIVKPVPKTNPMSTSKVAGSNFDWTTAAGLATSLGSNIQTALTANKMPQVADVTLTKAPRLKQYDFSDQQAALKEGLNTSLKATARNSTMRQAQEAGAGNVLAEYGKAANQMFGDANRANTNIANEQAVLGWKNSLNNAQITDQYRRDQQLREAAIQSVQSSNLADVGNKVQGFVQQSNQMKLDQQKMDLELANLELQAPGAAYRHLIGRGVPPEEAQQIVARATGKLGNITAGIAPGRRNGGFISNKKPLSYNCGGMRLKRRY